MAIRGRSRYGNPLAQVAASFTASASRRAPAFRWAVLTTLLVLWGVAGYISWQGEGATQAIYKTLGALAMTDAYSDVARGDWMREAARFAGVAIPLVGLLFAFSGALGRSLARVFNAGAAGHIVIAGSGPGAISLAHDCLRAHDVVFLIARDLPEETKWLLARRGGTLIEGDAARIEILKGARAHRAAHVVAFEEDEAVNLQIEALMRRAVGRRRRKRPVVVHVAASSSALLLEAREMRAFEQRRRDEALKQAEEQSSGAKRPRAAPALVMDPRPFSLNEIAARALINDHAGEILQNAKLLKHRAVHLLFVGFDAAAESVAVRMLMSLWSAHFDAPRLTVLARDAKAAERRFRSRFPHAFAYADLWTADIAFEEFEWSERLIDRAFIDGVNAARGAPSAIIVSTGRDSDNIVLALALKRACNADHVWPVPILMKETSQSEFSALYAKGDETAEHDAYLQAFGAVQVSATRANIIEGRLDLGAALQHRYYELGLAERGVAADRALQAMTRNWDAVLETYRDANRASADAAIVRLFDMGWRPATQREKKRAVAEPSMREEMMPMMARREHDRWVAERLLNGWRPGPKRDNDQRIHPNLVHWDKLDGELRKRDEDQVRAVMDVAMKLHGEGFMPIQDKTDAAPPAQAA
ncbi:MAG: NAD-binding protein [Hydrogenophilaceae bacterium]|jgi:hypothetical protein|nr:NAD-binding protein [Hydrogenophilaceae bacterium]